MRDALISFMSPNLTGRARTLESFYASVEFPELDVVTVRKRLCLFSGLRFILAKKINPVSNMAVRAEDVGPIVRH
jgi:hypothetical protein